MGYRHRIADELLEKKLRGIGAVLIEGDKLTDEGACGLHKLKSKIDTDKMKSPAFLMVLTAVGQYAYQRKDGVYVVPIGCLKP